MVEVPSYEYFTGIEVHAFTLYGEHKLNFIIRGLNFIINEKM